MIAYYNEIDPFAVKWLRNLIDAGLIAKGDVDERSIKDVTAGDLRGYTQHHFFAGIGGWSYALRLAGYPDNQQVWTGSCPCQPFSRVGNKKGTEDDRHLWPEWYRLIRECKPDVIFGEQVDAAIASGWLDSVQDDLEKEGYACGAASLPACSVGAPHIRQRLWFVGHSIGKRPHRWKVQVDETAQGWEKPVRQGINAGDVANTQSVNDTQDSSTGAVKWSDADWLSCTDGKFRPVEPGTFPLDFGIPNRVGRLRGYGNAIVPQVAAEFIKAFMEC